MDRKEESEAQKPKWLERADYLGPPLCQRNLRAEGIDIASVLGQFTVQGMEDDDVE